jgi:CubicO group peptidase (beta-lactamase class C family)
LQDSGQDEFAMTAQSPRRPRSLDETLLGELFEDAVRSSGAVGAQLSVVMDGQQVDFAAGLSNAEQGTEMTVDTLMQIGSVTKVLNATLIMSLVEEGVLDLDEPVSTCIPQFRVADREASTTLTVRHLLSMSSGLDNGPYCYFGESDEALKQYVEGLSSLPQMFEPGKYFGYSNAGVCIAGHAASVVAGESWEELLRQRVLEPAGVESAALLDADVVGATVSFGHVPSRDGVRPEVVAPTFSRHRSRAPSGSTLALSRKDLARFATVFLNAGAADTGARILSPASVAVMSTAAITVPSRNDAMEWCLGPYTANWNGTTLFAHSGGTPTSHSYLLWIPAHRAVMSYGMNTSAFFATGRFATSPAKKFRERMFNELMPAAFGFGKGRPETPAMHRTAIDYDRYVGVYEQFGIRLTVRKVGQNLVGEYETVDTRTASSMHMRETKESVTLMPVEGDRFLLIPQNADEAQGGDAEETAFFGVNEAGRATNVLNYVFAMRRVSS